MMAKGLSIHSTVTKWNELPSRGANEFLIGIIAHTEAR